MASNQLFPFSTSNQKMTPNLSISSLFLFNFRKKSGTSEPLESSLLSSLDLEEEDVAEDVDEVSWFESEGLLSCFVVDVLDDDDPQCYKKRPLKSGCLVFALRFNFSERN